MRDGNESFRRPWGTTDEGPGDRGQAAVIREVFMEEVTFAAMLHPNNGDEGEKR